MTASAIAPPTSPRKGRPWLMESVAAGGIVISAAVAGIGVAGIIGFESDLAKVGSAALVIGTLLTETAAARLPVHAEARAAEGGIAGGLKAGAVVLGFLALTGWNVTAGHMGMVAINDAGVADKRGPVERSLLSATAARETAEEALAAFDGRADRQAAAISDGLRGAMEAGYVTRSVQAIAGAGAGAEAGRAPLALRVAETRATERRARAALQAAPNGRPDHELWTFALILELLKGALVWFATGRERQDRRERSAEIIALAPKNVGDMTVGELEEMKRRGGSLTMTATWELRRRLRAA